MGRITAQEKESNKAKYDAIIFDLFINEGWRAVTLDRVAKECGIRKSTLQGYYKSKEHFAYALQGRTYPLFVEQLNFTSQDLFVESWCELLDRSRIFREVVAMLLDNLVHKGGGQGVRQALQRITNQLAKSMTLDDANKTIHHVFGATLFNNSFLEHQITTSES
ncbi:TetR family transcriptional regulator [Enterovibrio nigricans]|uniref:Transcriptional regulator, TetR family n=1 Tax=Enterovibrio nigricans DSM 22720 TaxID=1121868 RepID=A0A1T4UXL0_9GAMM|nr:TetR family transcriptional regulator [Enterovibrio nigricans]PKF50648.1 TetR/AcrR family transcriptional regulator [Enterovibrio nigricans]SKA57417.1 transcriptional regulator, TetR family [Enterovibrio nigricans DSM 22720]